MNSFFWGRLLVLGLGRWRVLAQEKLKGPILQWAGPSIVPSRPSFVLPSTASLQPSLVLMALIVWLRALGQYFFFFSFFFFGTAFGQYFEFRPIYLEMLSYVLETVFVFYLQKLVLGNIKKKKNNFLVFFKSKTCLISWN